MKKISALCLGLFLATCFVAAPVSAKKPKAAAIVQDIAGPKLEISKDGKSGWKKTKKNAPGYVSDHFRTDAKTAAAIELMVGGRIGIKKNSEILLLNANEAGVVENGVARKIQLKSGGMWAKFAKQDKGKKLTIQTRGGVMGIKGTEFTVDTNEENGQTDIELVEGSVDYTDNDGESHELEPGQKLVQFSKNGRLHVLTGLPDEVDREVSNFLNDLIPIDQLDVRRNILRGNWANLSPDLRASSITNMRGRFNGSFRNLNSIMNGKLRRATDLRGLIRIPRIPSVRIPGF